MLSSVCRMPSCRSREMRLRSPSIARARKCRSKKMFSTDGPTWRATRSNHIKSSRRKARRPFNKNSLPAGFPICSKETDMKDRSASTCCVADGSRGNAFKVRPSRRSHPNPAPAPTRLFQQIVEQKAVRAGKREIFWNQPLALTRSQLPHEDPLQIGVAIHQHCSIGVKSLRQLFQQQPQGFRETLIHLHCGTDPSQQFILGSKAAAQVTQERTSTPRGQRRADQA